MPSIASQSGSLFYAEKDAPLSKKPPLILIHGAGANHLVWPAELRRLPNLRVICVDLAGHGRSAPPAKQSIMAYAENIKQLMIALKIPQAIIVGHSMGGAIALTMGIYMPAYVAGLVLIGTGSPLKVNPNILNQILEQPAHIIDMINRWQWSDSADEGMRRLAKQQLLATDPQVIYNDYLACNYFDVSEQLATISAPTLIIGGENDKMTPFVMSETLANKIPHANLVKIERGGHNMHLEHRQLVASHISQWVEMFVGGETRVSENE